ncbi:Uncharacterized membrane protein [Amycolatopsis marina]|uniref:Uncharacterized protein n=4 Tax=Pseudonocardiaceae TaxID=2070 RepID=A0A2V4AEZ7_9PSEU|nr:MULTISPECIES: DUF2243 domain-containing protein [Pseudonocardiaceae]PXY17514.1 hypothetical protein BAY59_36245 [Prauserella coralliicola]MBE1579464.1 putative membrane protein [Amycolatopsis roodepoortensis]OLZ54260.1 hypothetical protein BS330_22095 [Amycolatopsis keratiniphila subsp. nogabecina]PXY17809.1 hypothetical protein BAY60_33965 [Prauserella muralis]TKG68289.1 DUF2243 domain-containing protein [Prauserella endophytica]
MTSAERQAPVGAAPAGLQLPGIVLGVGLGGFVDGILLHQLLQWHHMLTSTNTDNIGVEYYDPETVSGLEMNTVWDGVFHTVCWLAVLLGLAILYSRVTHNRRQVWTSRVLWGWILAGWGIFNLVEGVLDHHILGIHHVHGGPHQLWWDLGFLVMGAFLLVGGYLLQRSGRPVDPHAVSGGQAGRHD